MSTASGSSGSRDEVSRQLLAGIARSQVRWTVSNVHHGNLRFPYDPEALCLLSLDQQISQRLRCGSGRPVVHDGEEVTCLVDTLQLR